GVESFRAVVDAFCRHVVPVLLEGNAGGEGAALRGEVLLRVGTGEDLDGLPGLFRMPTGGRDAEAGAGADGDAAGRADREGGKADLELDRTLEIDELPRAIDDHGHVPGGKTAAAEG